MSALSFPPWYVAYFCLAGAVVLIFYTVILSSGDELLLSK